MNHQATTWDIWNGLPRLDKEREELPLTPIRKLFYEASHGDAEASNDADTELTDANEVDDTSMATLMKALEAEKQKCDQFFDIVLEDLSNTLTDNDISRVGEQPPKQKPKPKPKPKPSVP